MAEEDQIGRKAGGSKWHIPWFKRAAEEEIGGGVAPSVGTTAGRTVAMPAAVILLAVSTGDEGESLEEDEDERGRSAVRAKKTDRRGY
jgi:hypothetical protein